MGKNKPDPSPLKQQTLKAWRPILTPRLVILLFAAIGIIFIPIGTLIISVSNGVVEVVGSDYARSCCVDNCDSRIPWQRSDANPCNVSITIDTAMEPPIYVYYKLTDFYQNHRRYVRSRDDGQLNGDVEDEESLLQASSCRYHVLGAPSGTPNNVINPCGLVAWSVFNDSFTMFTAAGAQVRYVASSVGAKVHPSRAC